MLLQSIPSRSLVRHLGPWRTGGSEPAYRQLAERLRLLILDGRLPLGARLPGERELARAVGVSRTTSAAAYAMLRDRGFVESRPGSGARTRLPANPDAIQAALEASHQDDQPIDLTIASFPAGMAVHHAYCAALERLPAYLGSKGYELAGLDALRSAIALRYEARGLPTAPSQIMVTNGALHGLALLLWTFCGPGDRVVVDHPTFPRAIGAIERARLMPVPVSLPDAGWDVDGIAAALRQSSPKLAYLVPDFHNPTGRCMDSATRGQVAALARETRTTLVFDETLTDLGIDVDVPAPDPYGERGVVRLGSLAKSHWGGLRVGWIRAEREIVQALADTRASIDLGTPVLEQLAATLLIGSTGELARRRVDLRCRRDKLLALIAERLPAWKPEIPAGGASVWVELPGPLSSALAATAGRYGVKLAAGPRFGLGGAFERFVRLPFTQSAETLRIAVDRLAQAYERVAPAVREESFLVI